MQAYCLPLHKVVLQNLYSTKCGWSKSLCHGYSIAQARSDVFFSLLFGGQICASAGAFFDSPIALRVIGELSSHPLFLNYCRLYGWRPLALNTDMLVNNSTDPDPIDYIVSRWRNPKTTFGFFRDGEPGFEDLEATRPIKLLACMSLEKGHFENLENQFETLYKDHHTDLFDPDWERHQAEGFASPRPATTPAILTPDTWIWLKAILGYIHEFQMMKHRNSADHPEVLDSFRPMQAIIERTASMWKDTPNYKKEELEELNREFLGRIGNPVAMNPIHNEAPSLYGHYYPLIAYWMETEWHQVRQRTYGAKTCILSSDWMIREVQDFDELSKATYLRDERVDDSLRMAQEQFGEISWDLLFEVVSNPRWRSLVQSMHDPTATTKQEAIGEEILGLLAASFGQFHITNEKGFVHCAVKKTALASSLLAYTGLASDFCGSLHGALGLPQSMAPLSSGGISHAFLAAAPLLGAFGHLLKGTKHIYVPFKERQLRRVIVPDIYGA